MVTYGNLTCHYISIIQKCLTTHLGSFRCVSGRYHSSSTSIMTVMCATQVKNGRALDRQLGLRYKVSPRSCELINLITPMNMIVYYIYTISINIPHEPQVTYSLTMWTALDINNSNNYS